MSLRYYQGNLGVVHDVIVMKWQEIAAISVAVWWLVGGEEWWWSLYCGNHYVLLAGVEMYKFVTPPLRQSVPLEALAGSRDGVP